MKTKISLLTAVLAILTLSFTFVNVESSPGNKKPVSKNSMANPPIGGFVADDVVK